MEPKFCMMPIARPRRSGDTASAVIDCEIGATPPSATPISILDPSNTRKELASPLMNEHSENAMVAAIKYALRRPPRSAAAPTHMAESAQANESAEEVRPTCVLVSLRSGSTNGITKFNALRSKKRMPKFKLNRATRRTW